MLYQAGADPHIDDPLGDFLTTAQLAMRDWKVFEGLAARGVPVAWNLAGGYQKPLAKVIDLHLTTLRLCIEATALATPRRSQSRSGRPADEPSVVEVRIALERRAGDRDEDRAQALLAWHMP